MPINMHPELPAGDNPKTKAPARVLGGGVPPGSPNSDPISDQKCHFSHLFSDLAYKQKPLRNYVIIIKIRTPTQKIS